MAALTNLKQCPPVSMLPDLALRHNHIPELDRYPKINLKNEIFNHNTGQRFVGGQRFMSVNESVLKRITRTFFDAGFLECLAEARNEATRQQAPWIGKAGDHLAHLLGFLGSLKQKVFPYIQEVGEERIAQYMETRDWATCDVRCLAWHRHSFRLAVVGGDDAVRIYLKSTNANPTVLKSPSQTQITCLEWRPLCPAEIVIGCRQGLCFWIVDNNVQLGRTTMPTQTFKHPANLPITSLQWNKNGNLLATSSIGDRSILIWEPDSGQMQVLKRLGPPGSLVKWSPDNDWLFASTVDRVFRVWNCYNEWTTERWVCGNGGTVQTACWSPCGRFLLFVSTSEPILYRLQFVPQQMLKSTDDKEVLPIADLNACSLDGNQTLIGGPVQQLAWDPHGNYLVITFKTTNCIAVFRTFIQKFDLQISAAYYLSGETATEYPTYICFQPLYNDNDRSVLTIAWSSARIQYYAFD
ncbi:uncharacterized protein Dwil_GK25372 [Drosophila willistoni]|uniref:Aladin seven-bladed propeller domain-containing protein n=1 Tax=Drosophila willistoni TaxID=7260 RepID=B4NE14_DROWI|nr:aladin [Drosophila willistoni]EDW81983.1 uncharacterized protein Dwil_GK25372 [Drosophila willistoni]